MLRTSCKKGRRIYSYSCFLPCIQEYMASVVDLPLPYTNIPNDLFPSFAIRRDRLLYGISWEMRCLGQRLGV